MNYNQLITLLSLNVGCAEEQVRAYTDALVKWMSEKIAEQQELLVAGFGKFFLELQHEYVFADEKGKRILMPPNLTLRFTPIALVENMEAGEGKVFPAIADYLVGQQKAEKHVAERLAVAFFKCILDMMDKGEPVEADGLGTFLLTRVNVDNKVYGKVAFTPDEELALMLNRPFAYFPSVELKEGVDFDDVKVVSAHDKSFDEPADNQVFLISQTSDDEDSDTDVTPETPDNTAENSMENVDGVGENAVEENNNPSNEGTASSGEMESTATSDQADEDSLAQQEAAEDEQDADETPASLGRESLMDDGSVEGDAPQRKNVMRWALWALAGCLLLAGVYFMLFNRSGEDETTVARAGTEQSGTMAGDSLAGNADADSVTVTGTSKAEASIDFAAMNAQIPYGAYDIVAIDTIITVMPGQDLATISRLYLGTDILIYLIVANDGNNDPHEGDKYRIPRLQMRKTR